ncbi:MAG: hypothetical protein Q9M91_00690 [Candidatus Dojkabacteria bacterium]|nr:hypothetical protein [Candidatus Dojkabacteria bacterium]
MDRDQRKQMIIDTYKKILGDEPKQNDLNYYLNMGISEEELIKKIVDTEDFKKMVKDAKDAIELREKSAQMDTDLAMYKGKATDLQGMLDNLNKVLAHKNLSIQQMQNELINRGVVQKGQYYHPNQV